jgi:hypothetical protein
MKQLFIIVFFLCIGGKRAPESSEFDGLHSNRVSTVLTDRKQLEVLCAERQWKVVDVAADGDCMFSGLAFIQLYFRQLGP